MNSSQTSPGPAELYQHDLQQGLIEPDAAQQAAVAALEARYRFLLRRWQRPQGKIRSLLSRLSGRAPATSMPGLYFWGGVGRGKTFLMDLFFQALPGERKLRMHFHRFMLMVHRRLRDEQGHSDPLTHVARSIARETDVICFDEFYVSDIGDAMILANLLETLFAEGVMLIATSNIVPDRLYERGLQRQKFLPAIALLKRHTQVLNVDGGVDYRLQSLNRAPVYYHPLDAHSLQGLQQMFADLTRGLHVESDKVLEVERRELPSRYWAEDVVWFDFATLCRGARAAADYIELARQFHTVFIEGVPAFGEQQDDEARRFITLVDEFYDHSVKLVISAEQPIDRLYQGGDLEFPFERTVSRLLEMQTQEYLAAPHHPD